MSACMSGTRGSGVLSSTGDVLVRGLWQISQIQTFLFRVVGPGLVSTSPAFVSNSASHPAGPHAPKTVNRAPIARIWLSLTSDCCDKLYKCRRLFDLVTSTC